MRGKEAAAEAKATKGTLGEVVALMVLVALLVRLAIRDVSDAACGGV